MTIGPTSTARAREALTKVQDGNPRRLSIGTLWVLSYVRLLTDKSGIFCYIEVFKLKLLAGAPMINDLFSFPITGWEIKTAPDEGVLSVRFPFLSHEEQKLAEADPGRPYIMRADEARELRDALSRALQYLDNHDDDSAFSTNLRNSLLIY